MNKPPRCSIFRAAVLHHVTSWTVHTGSEPRGLFAARFACRHHISMVFCVVKTTCWFWSHSFYSKESFCLKPVFNCSSPAVIFCQMGMQVQFWRIFFSSSSPVLINPNQKMFCQTYSAVMRNCYIQKRQVCYLNNMCNICVAVLYVQLHM